MRPPTSRKLDSAGDNESGRDSRWRWMLASVAGTLLLLALESLSLLGLRNRVVLVVDGAMLIAAVLMAERHLRALPNRWAIPVALLSSVCLAGAAAALSGGDRGAALMSLLRPTLAGWIASLTMVAALARTDGRRGPWPPLEWRPSRVHLLVGLIATAALLTMAHHYAVGRWAIVSDEVVSLVQSRWIDPPHLSWPVDSALADHFLMRKVGYSNGQLYGMYAPGWPALLAGFRGLGLEWWSSIILGTTSVWLLYHVARRVTDARVATLASVLLAASQFYVMTHAGYMSHAATICASLAATWCVLAGLDRSLPRSAPFFLGGGALLGFVVTVRPLTGLTLGLSIGLWMLAVARRTSRPWVPMGALTILGAALPAALFVFYNLTVFGKPVALGYAEMHGSMYDLGFGNRGFTVLNDSLQRIPTRGQFTPVNAIADFLSRIAQLNTTFVPIGMLFPLAAFALAVKAGIRWRVALTFGVLPLGHMLYWYGGLRLYTELLPFLILGAAVMVVGIGATRPRLAVSLFALMLASQLLIALPWPRSVDSHRVWSNGVDHAYGQARGRFATFEYADSLAEAHGKVLLFVRETSRIDNFMDRLYLFNGQKENSPILVARDLGPRNADLLRRFPDRVPFLVTDRGWATRAEFERMEVLDKAEASRARPH